MTICQQIGHIWKKYGWELEKCWRCGHIIKDRAIFSHRQRELYKTAIAPGIRAEKHLKSLWKYYIHAEKIFDGGTDAKVANAIYYMRYVRELTLDSIVRDMQSTHAVLNAYIVRFPAIFRDGKLVALRHEKELSTEHSI